MSELRISRILNKKFLIMRDIIHHSFMIIHAVKDIMLIKGRH